jgi:hypothetical protein
VLLQTWQKLVSSRLPIGQKRFIVKGARNKLQAALECPGFQLGKCESRLSSERPHVNSRAKRCYSQECNLAENMCDAGRQGGLTALMEERLVEVAAEAKEDGRLGWHVHA